VNYRDAPQEAAFRHQLRAWLAANAPADPVPRGGPERAALWRDWHEALYRDGWMGLSWPTAYGGRGLPAVYEAILNDEVGAAGAPPVPHVGFLGRAMLRFGSEAQRREHLPGLLSGEVVWCQGFSEPDAGSDLASVRTRARLEGDRFVVDGQKVWTSDAAWADRCLLLARTDPDAPKHEGLSALVVDMHASGVVVRPIVQANGDTEFNEVFFDQVPVPVSNLIGERGEGWALAMATVSYERGPADVGFSSRYTRLLRELEDEGRAASLDEPSRLALAEAFVATEVLRLHVLRSLSRRDDGSDPGAEGSIDKLLATHTEQLLHHVAMDQRGASALTRSRPDVLEDYLYSRAASIAGGTSQIQRTIVAERVLGLPRGR